MFHIYTRVLTAETVNFILIEFFRVTRDKNFRAAIFVITCVSDMQRKTDDIYQNTCLFDFWLFCSTDNAVLTLLSKSCIFSVQSMQQGDYNRGHYNRGHYNWDHYNRGDDNRGDDNRGDDNRGDDNRGDDNRGDDNRGDDNRGDDNRGDDNGGDDNGGD